MIKNRVGKKVVGWYVRSGCGPFLRNVTRLYCSNDRGCSFVPSLEILHHVDDYRCALAAKKGVKVSN